jgi:putative DeoR family transcriptional regulator (stage III sporulation protein D)
VTRNIRKAPDLGTKQERCVSLGKYIIGNNATVREAAKVFGISKSTVHNDVTNLHGRIWLENENLSNY